MKIPSLSLLQLALLFMTAALCPLLALSSPLPATSTTEPQQIVPITQVLHHPGYYATQVKLWAQELEQDQSNSNAWLNYYLASRTVNMLDKDQNPHDLEEIHKALTQQIPYTYEYYYLSYLHSGGDPTLHDHLLKAYAIDPDRTEIYSHMINQSLIDGDKETYSKFCKLWKDSGEIATGILSWNYNALIGLEPNAILLTHGDNDTYPSWMLQEVDAVRPDVTVLNVHLLRNRAYCDRMFKQLGIALYPEEAGDAAVWDTDLLPVVDHIMEGTAQPLYLNVTLPRTIRESYEEVLYTVGLAFRYSTTPFDNIAMIRENYEQKFLMDYLRMGFAVDEKATVLNAMNVNYLPAFVSLYKDYVKRNELAKATEIKKVLLNIGRANGKEKQILALIAQPKKWKKDTKTYMDIKAIDKGLKQVKPRLWAAETETTNAQYEAFLMDLLKHKEFELLETCKTTKVNWMSLLPEKFKHLTAEEVFRNTGGTPDDARVPVNNISYAAAEAYCEWLTLAYNGYDKKKKHLRVKFRLPTEAEWELAARAGHKDAAYPWGGQYYRNVKGCYLSNFYSSDDEPCHDCKVSWHDIDGSFFPVNGDAYFANDLGLYGMSGNVAEITAGGQVAKGGSWEDLPKDCTITSKKTIKGKSPAIGFRVFMEIVN